MIIAYFENGFGLNSKSGALTENYLVVEQVKADTFVIKNSRNEIVMSNFHKVEKACKFAQSGSRTYKLN